jgi:glutathione S-transferase
MIELHHCVSARSFRPLWMLEELGMPYTLKMWPFPPRSLARDYLAINPLGTVPLLVNGDVRMTESAAACQYLATLSPGSSLDVAANDAAFGAFLNWLHFGEATLTFPQTLVLRYAHFEPDGRRLPQVADDYARWFLARLRAIDAALAGSDYLCADRFTAADVSVGYALMLGEYLGLEERFPPAVLGYWRGHQQRPAYQRALAAQHAAAEAQGVSTQPAPLAGREADTILG